MASNSHTVPNASVSAGAETGVDTVTGRTEAQGHYRSPVQAKTDVRLRIKHQIYKQDTLQNELEEIIVIPSYTGDSVNTVDIEYGSVIKEATNSDPSPPSMPEKEYKIEDKMMTALKMAFMFFGFPFSIMFAVKPKIGDAAYTIFAILGTIGVLCYLAVILIGLLFRVWQVLETPSAKRIIDYLILLAVASTAGAFLTYLWMTMDNVLSISLCYWSAVVLVLTVAAPIFIRLRGQKASESTNDIKNTSTSTKTEQKRPSMPLAV